MISYITPVVPAEDQGLILNQASLSSQQSIIKLVRNFTFQESQEELIGLLPTALFSGRGGTKMPLYFSKRRSRNQTKSL